MANGLARSSMARAHARHSSIRHDMEGPIGPLGHAAPAHCAWPMAQAWPAGPFLVPGWPKKHATANGPCQPKAH